MKDKDKWSGSVTDLLCILERVAVSASINTNSKNWPMAANILSKRLREVKSNLEELGIHYDIRHSGNYKTIIIVNENNQQVAATQMQDLTMEENDEPKELLSTPVRPQKKVIRKKDI
jgi:uncharacterized protein with GYD domain